MKIHINPSCHRGWEQNSLTTARQSPVAFHGFLAKPRHRRSKAAAGGCRRWKEGRRSWCLHLAFDTSPSRIICRFSLLRSNRGRIDSSLCSWCQMLLRWRTAGCCWRRWHLMEVQGHSTARASLMPTDPSR